MDAGPILEVQSAGASLLASAMAGAGAGLISAPHCALMCGGYAGFALRGAGAGGTLRYALGRALAYALLGALAGRAGAFAAGALFGTTGMLLSVGLALAMLLTAWSLRPRAQKPETLVPLRCCRPPRRSERFVAALPREPLLYGVLNGLLPCGALAGALILAATTAAPLAGAVAMMSFAVASLPGLLAAAWLLRRTTRRQRNARPALAVGLVFGALVLLARPVAVLVGEDPACCDAVRQNSVENSGEITQTKR
ncbi:MAG: sulfite exporter TauE/SafE family protein [Myxococcota bacterium]